MCLCACGVPRDGDAAKFYIFVMVVMTTMMVMPRVLRLSDAAGDGGVDGDDASEGFVIRPLVALKRE